MHGEAEIAVNGTRLTHDEARIVRLALESFADILENQLGFKDDGIQISDKCVTDTTRILALISERAKRKQ